MSHKPTEEQQRVIDAIVAGESIIVNALAGAAKSTTIEMGAKALAARAGALGVDGMALAFNKKIAEELGPRLPFPVKTLNALGHGAWAKKVGKVTLQSDKMTAIKNGVEKGLPWELVRLVGLAKLNGLVPEAFAGVARASILPDVESSWEGLAEDIDLNLEFDDPATGKRVDLLPHARTMLRKSVKDAMLGVIDFDDQVYMPTCFGGQWPTPQVLFVDEAQDLSPLNHLMLKALKPRQLVVVGDPNQSIYAFRGADTSSMPLLEESWGLKPLTLTTSFRCSKAVADEARKFTPEMRTPEWAQEGRVINLTVDDPDGNPLPWDFGNLPAQVTVLCRNNAPLIKIALKIFKHKHIAFLGGKGAAQMLATLRQITNYKGRGMAFETVVRKIDEWRTEQILSSKPSKHETIMDKAEALLHCCEAASDYVGVEAIITELFERKNAPILFGTGHGSKGLEWHNVLFLDEHLIPSSFANSPEALQQEHNLAYVITTRAKDSLFFARTEDFKKKDQA